MEYEALKGLEPREFFYWFGEISQIPRESRHEEKAIAFCQRFAAERGLPCETDAKGNVMIRVPASEGYEKDPSILMQAHLDMVCVKDPGVEFDFASEPIRFKISDGKLWGDGTTLGADNGVGVATMLALADSREIPHPALELLFTVEEEIGLKGIRAADMTKIRSRRMLNMDSGYSHIACVSSAGSISSRVKKQFEVFPIPRDSAVLRVGIDGCKGGHSGIMAAKGRACAGNELGELLSALEKVPVRLCALRTDSRPILKSCEAVVAVPREREAECRVLLGERFSAIRDTFRRIEPDMRMILEEAEAETCADRRSTGQILAALRMLHTGVWRLDENDPSITITSSTLMAPSFDNGAMEMRFSIRSSNDADKEELFRRASFLVSLLDMELEKLDEYSGWEEKRNSPFLERFMRAHEKLCGFPMELERVHGGIEVGIILGAIPDMDAVGYAPTAHGAHTTGEYLELGEAEPFWQVLKEVLAQHG